LEGARHETDLKGVPARPGANKCSAVQRRSGPLDFSWVRDVDVENVKLYEGR
jgi:hypothetical protein